MLAVIFCRDFSEGDRDRTIRGGGSIVVCDYDPTWVAQFERERTQLSNVLGFENDCHRACRSTSVPGLAAKPIIDLLVGVKSLSEARFCCLDPLGARGYAYMPEYEPWLPEELFFRKRGRASGVAGLTTST